MCCYVWAESSLNRIERPPPAPPPWRESKNEQRKSKLTRRPTTSLPSPPTPAPPHPPHMLQDGHTTRVRAAPLPPSHARCRQMRHRQNPCEEEQRG